MDILRTNGLKQVALLLLIVFIGILLIWQLQYFIPGFLGAITLYVLLRQVFFNLTLVRGWKRWVAALVLILACIVVVVIPVWLLVELLMPRISYSIAHSDEIMDQVRELVDVVRKYFPKLEINDERIQAAINQGIQMLPRFLNATMSVIMNTLTAFFILYFMFMSGMEMELKMTRLLPLKDTNKDSLWSETRNMVVSNAIGIPVLMMCQSLVAILGYWIFGVDAPVLWGIFTGVASVVPMVGTMVVWIPICVLIMAQGHIGAGIGLALYCAIVVSNIDNVLRFSIMKKIGNVHPLITVFGVIVGLQLFGIMGLIFGPLLIAYFILLIKIYRLEFSSSIVSHAPEVIINNESQSGIINTEININTGNDRKE